MSRKLTITRTARLDLVRIRRWLTQRGAGPTAAVRLHRIEAMILSLTRDPIRWPRSRFGADLREVVVESHCIVYAALPDDECQEGTIVLLRVFGPGQNRDSLGVS